MAEKLSVLEVVGQRGIADALAHLAGSAVTGRDRSDLEDVFHGAGVAAPSRAVDELLECTLIEHYGDKLGISLAGIRVSLLLEALNGADIVSICQQLGGLSGATEMYELVREGMTNIFVRSLIDRGGFGRLYFCSPWINPSERERAMLRYGVMREERQAGHLPEIIVVTRPSDSVPPETRDGLAPFREIGAKIYYHRRLHSKLYIREPGPQGGIPMAIVGSQNLTRSNWLELGIRVNGDTRIITQLIRYFLDVMSWSTEEGYNDE